MDAEFARLEEKVNLLARLATELRSENQTLRQRLLQVQQDNSTLKQKVDVATARVAAILAKMPEETE